MNEEIYQKAKYDFINTRKPSITAIASKYGVDRKKLSKLLKADGLRTNNKGYTDNQIEEAMSLLRGGMSFTEMCKVLDVPRLCFSEYLDKIGVRSMKREGAERCKTPIDGDVAKGVIKDYTSGMTRKNIMKKYNIYDTTMYKVLKTNGIDLDPKHKRIHTLDEDTFKTIDSERKAYWLGFLFADGNVNQALNVMEITLQDRDHYILEDLQNLCGSDAPISRKEVPLDGKVFIAYRISLCSQKFASHLNEKGCVPNKSLILEKPKGVPKALIHHFIRGYIDGDGCVCTSNELRKDGTSYLSLRVSILGTKALLEWIDYNISSNAETNPRNIRCDGHHGKAFVIAYGGNRICRKVYEYLYKDATIYMERKKDKFDAVLG